MQQVEPNVAVSGDASNANRRGFIYLLQGNFDQALKKPDKAPLLEPAINLLQEVCERENVGTCPDISDIIELINNLPDAPGADMAGERAAS